jgi:Zn-dependent M16 (insulinase) family peptidase
MPLSILSSSITNLPTKDKDILTLQGEIKAKCGTFYSSSAAIDKDGTAHTYLTFFASCLESKADCVAELLCEVLRDTVFGDGKEILEIAKQARSHIEDAIITSGESTALSRVEASYSDAGIISERLSGYEAYKALCSALKTDEESASLLKKVEDLYRRLIKSSRLTVSVSGGLSDELVRSIIDAIPEGDEIAYGTEIAPCADKREFFVIPSKVAYSAYGAISEEAKGSLGILRVARSLLSYEYLWNTVRVKNGAYGTGFIPRRGGQIIFYSYRDPSPNNSVVYFRESAEYLRALADSDPDLTKFIIGAVGEYDMLTTPKTKALLATRRYLAGIAPDEESRLRRDMLAMTADDLCRIADMIDSVADTASLVVVGAKEHLDSMKDDGFSVIKI